MLTSRKWICCSSKMIFWIIIFGLRHLKMAQASVSCETDADCQALYKLPTTVCLPEKKKCSNPFQQGCLTGLRKDKKDGEKDAKFPKRVCNSDEIRFMKKNDKGEIIEKNPENCKLSNFTNLYPEIRIHNANWESSFILAWIYQIVLSELVEVPSTVGLNSSHTPMASFYSQDNEFIYSQEAYPYHALGQANAAAGIPENRQARKTTVNERKRNDCSNIENKTAPCVDILPEVWEGQITEYTPLILNRTIEPSSGNGLLGRSGFYVPSRTAREVPQLGFWYGMAGEENRQLLAETFLRPMSWVDFCRNVSETRCQEATETAARFPTEPEEDLYFAEGLYTGYFYATDANNCTLNPTTCTGHIVTGPCTWSAPIDAQLYWNNIVGLSRDGPVKPVGGYTESQMTQIYQAANATRSHIILTWYDLVPLFAAFQGSDYEFLHITLPAATFECLVARPDSAARCDPSYDVRRGNSSLAACALDTQVLQQLIAQAVPEHNSALPDVDQSPADEFIKNLQITTLQMNAIIRAWKATNVDPMGNDVRAAVCEWVQANLGSLKSAIPKGYPRHLESRSDFKAWYSLTARIVAYVVGGIAIWLLFAVYRHRNTKAMVFAQPVFLQFILMGFLLICAGAVLTTMKPEDTSCMASAWLLMLGYTIELVPVLVKTSKINQLVRAYAKNQKRIQVKRRAMILKVVVIVAFVVAFMTAWTIIDPYEPKESRSLDTSGEDGDVVEYDFRCASNSEAWRLFTFAWQAILLILAAFLAFQGRAVMAQLNESKSLAVMVYSHSLFVCLRGVTAIFYIQETFPSSVTQTIMSLVFSLDSLAAMCIYVVPKVLAARQAPNAYKPGMLSSTVARASSIGETEDGQNLGAVRFLPKALPILVCSANLGNKAPTPESLEAWIPPGGNCDYLQPLEEDMSPPNLDFFQTFGLIAIGMQEATWSESNLRASSTKSAEITEEEVLNALEEANTAQLREMVQNVLGDNYFQICDERRGQMRLSLWATRHVARNVIDVKISGANTGIGNMLANKGGIVATVYFKKTRISFVTAHLAAHEGDSYYKTRCDNIRSILREAKTYELSSKFDVGTSSHHTFFLGDLNFRTRFENKHSHEENVASAKALIESGALSTLYSLDELQQGLKNEDFLAGFQTLVCPFQPTFKVEREPGINYKGQRIPSWTDRILFRSSPGLKDHLKALSYEACPDFITSDHKPIRGAFCVMPNQDLDTLRVDSDTTFEFHKIRCSDLPSINISTHGKADPYVMLLWDGAPLYAENKDAWDFLRALWKGKSWPRTDYIPKTMNPYWKGESITLGLKQTFLFEDGMIFVAVMNYDKVLGRHDFLGAVVLNVKGLLGSSMNMVPTVNGQMEERTLSIEERLVKDGKYIGNIKFKVSVKRKREAMTREVGRRRSSLINAMRSKRFNFNDVQKCADEVSLNSQDDAQGDNANSHKVTRPKRSNFSDVQRRADEVSLNSLDDAQGDNSNSCKVTPSKRFNFRDVQRRADELSGSFRDLQV